MGQHDTVAEEEDDDADDRFVIRDIEDPDGVAELSRAVSPSVAVQPASPSDDGRDEPGDLVTRTLAMLPGGQDEIGREAESWIERERWDENEADYWEGQSG
jgi:hypothetical protein